MSFDNFVIKNLPNKKKGLFSLKDFNKNTVLFRLDGIKIEKNANQTEPHHLQIGLNLYLDLTNYPSFFINHSCKPNCYIKIAANTAFLLSYIPIKSGDELTFDYSLTSTENTDTWSMPCNCSLFGCRKIVSGFSGLSDKEKESYIKLVPSYVRQK